MMVCAGLSGLATALSTNPTGSAETSADSIMSRRRVDWIKATSHFTKPTQFYIPTSR